MTRNCQAENEVNDVDRRRLPQVTESYDVAGFRRLYSGGVAKRTGQKERQGGRELWDGKRIREVREERKLSRPQLAEASGVNEDDIGRHERNDPASNPSMDTLVRLALALKVRPGVLLEPTGTQIR